MLIVVSLRLIIAPLERIFHTFVNPVLLEVDALETPLVALLVNSVFAKFVNVVDVVKEFASLRFLLQLPVKAVFSEVLQNDLSSIERMFFV